MKISAKLLEWLPLICLTTVLLQGVWEFPFYCEGIVIVIILSGLLLEGRVSAKSFLTFGQGQILLLSITGILLLRILPSGQVILPSFLALTPLLLLALCDVTALPRFDFDRGILACSFVLSAYLLLSGLGLLPETLKGLRSVSSLANFGALLAPLAASVQGRKELRYLASAFLLVAIFTTHDIASSMVAAGSIFILLFFSVPQWVINQVPVLLMIFIPASFTFPWLAGPIKGIPGFIQGRLLIQQISFRLLSGNEVWGIGLGRFSGSYLPEQAKVVAATNLELNPFPSTFQFLDNVYWPYNEYLNLLLECGGLLFSVSCALLWLYLRRISLLVEFDRRIFPFMIVVINILLLAFVDNIFHISLPLAIVALAFLQIERSNLKTSWQLPVNWSRALVLFLLLLTVRDVYYRYHWLLAVRGADDDYRRLQYEVAFPGLIDNGSFLFGYGKQLSRLNKPETAIPVLERAGRYYPHSDLFLALGNLYEEAADTTAARKNYTLSANMVPVKLLPRYELFLHDLKYNRIAEASRQARIIDKIPMKVTSPDRIRIKGEIKAYLEELPR